MTSIPKVSPLVEYSDEDLAKKQDCYGTAFSALESVCVSECPARDRCLSRMAMHQLALVAGSVAAIPKEAKAVAEMLDVSIADATLVLQVRAGKTPYAALVEREKLIDDAGIDEDDGEIPESLDTLIVATPTLTASSPVPVEAEPDPKPKKKEKVAKPKKEKDETTKSSKYARERARSAWVASLPDGFAVVRDYKGAAFSLRVSHADECYYVNDKPFPSLYAATASIVGLVSHQRPDGKTSSPSLPWSLQRFWGSKGK